MIIFRPFLLYYLYISYLRYIHYPDIKWKCIIVIYRYLSSPIKKIIHARVEKKYFKNDNDDKILLKMKIFRTTVLDYKKFYEIFFFINKNKSPKSLIISLNSLSDDIQLILCVNKFDNNDFFRMIIKKII